jgi:S-(hydroxymethyl)glutathione dehydrogenase / alcohol dehydrogenase
MRSKAAILVDFGKPLEIHEIDVAAPRENEVRVKIAASGVCHSDLHAAHGVYGGNLPAILGHEGSGVVESVGEGVQNVAPGDHVIISWKPTCGHCRSCLRGRPNLCEGVTWADSGRMKDKTSRYSLSGADILHFGGVSTFTEYSVIPAECAVKIDRDLPLIPMSLIGCAVTTGVGAAINTARIVPGDSVAIIGCGGVGLSSLQGARIAGAKNVIAVDQSDGALSLARSLGATHTINSSREEPGPSILNVNNGGVDWAIEAVGRQETMDLAISVLNRGGQAVLAGVARAETTVSFKPFVLVRQENAILGSFYGSAKPFTDFPRFANFYKEGVLDLDSMVTERKLEDINEILNALESGANGRNVIVF